MPTTSFPAYDRLSVESTLGGSPEQGAGRRLVKMIALAGLIVDEVDDAEGVHAKRIPRGRISVPTHHDADIEGPAGPAAA